MIDALLVPRPRALMYHAFTDGPRVHDPQNLFVHTDDFAEQLRRLRRGGWEALDLDQFARSWAGGRRRHRATLVTIDDAHRSALTLALPVLRREAVPAIVFAPAGLVGGTMTWDVDYRDEPLCDADELRTLAAEGVEVGVHGWDHRRMAGLEPGELRRQVDDAADAVADIVGRRPRAFAFPYGDHDPEAVRAVARAGFLVGFATDRGCGRHAIARPGITGADSERTFDVKLLPRYRSLRRVAAPAAAVRRHVRRVLAS